jgi:hypothetical protein|eukprot:evm.model.NODE_12080_length_44339_cov_18.134035.14
MLVIDEFSALPFSSSTRSNGTISSDPELGGGRTRTCVASRAVETRAYETAASHATDQCVERWVSRWANNTKGQAIKTQRGATPLSVLRSLVLLLLLLVLLLWSSPAF